MTGAPGMEPRICELRENYALRKIPTRSFAANALYLEILRLAYNLVTAFQRNCLDTSWQNLTLSTLRHCATNYFCCRENLFVHKTVLCSAFGSHHCYNT